MEISQPVADHAGRVRPPAARASALLDRVLDDRRASCCRYLSLKLQARFRSPAAIEELARKKHLRNARRIHRTIARLQGLFIKIGQLISIMTNFLPEEFRAELEGLQDQVPPRPYADVEQRFREEFDGKAPRELFAEFDERPIASASIGQVHAARLPTGERSRSRCSTRTSRRSSPSICARCAASSASSPGSCRTRAWSGSIARFAR